MRARRFQPARAAGPARTHSTLSTPLHWLYCIHADRLPALYTSKARLANGDAVVGSNLDSHNCVLKLDKYRALMIIDSPQLLRQISAHRCAEPGQAVAGMIKTAGADAIPTDIRQRARVAIAELPHVDTMMALVPDLAHPWSPATIHA